MAPRVSVVTATYRRPLVLRAAIGSVLAQDMPEWEHIGDGCADDTEAMVHGFADPRIRWHNLPVNSGGQSAPNNAGVALAGAPLVAFLNQHDLWFPDHLSTALAFHAETGAELSVCPMLVRTDGTRAEGPPDPRRDVLRTGGWTKSGAWNPEVFYLASCWVVSRAAIERVGPWADASRTRLSPSAEWLWRASRLGLPVALRPRVTVLRIHAAARRGTYVARRSPEHERALGWVTAGGRPAPPCWRSWRVGTAPTCRRRGTGGRRTASLACSRASAFTGTWCAASTTASARASLWSGCSPADGKPRRQGAGAATSKPT